MEIRIELNDPGGNPLKVSQVTITQAVNRGWTWSAVLSEPPPLDSYLEDQTYSLTVHVGADSLTLPPLVALDYEADHVRGGGTVSGIDLVMYRLTRSTHHGLDNSTGQPFQNTNTTYIIDQMASDMNLTGKVTGHNAFQFQVLELEWGGRMNYLSPFERFCGLANYEFRVEDNAGTERLVFFPLDWNGLGGSPLPSPQPPWSSVVRRRRFFQRITRLTFVKTSRIQTGQEYTAAAAGDTFNLNNTFHSAQASDPTVELYLGDPDAGGVLRGSGVSFDSGDVTWAKATRDGRFTVMGTPTANIPAGVELAFEHTHDSFITPQRPADDPWEETLWPNKQYVIDRAEAYLWKRNRDTHTVHFEGPPVLTLGIGHRLDWPGCPQSRAETITHVLGAGQASTSVDAAALGSAQW